MLTVITLKCEEICAIFLVYFCLSHYIDTVSHPGKMCFLCTSMFLYIGLDKQNFSS